MDSPNSFLPSTGHRAELHFQGSPEVRCSHVTEFWLMAWIQTHPSLSCRILCSLSHIPSSLSVRYREASGGMNLRRQQTHIIEKFYVPKWPYGTGPSPISPPTNLHWIRMWVINKLMSNHWDFDILLKQLALPILTKARKLNGSWNIILLYAQLTLRIKEPVSWINPI